MHSLIFPAMIACAAADTSMASASSSALGTFTSRMLISWPRSSMAQSISIVLTISLDVSIVANPVSDRCTMAKGS